MTDDSIQAELTKLRTAVGGLEARRAALGDAIVAPALASLREKIAALEAQAAAQPSPAAERSIVTILFTDIVGSTALAAKLDPEDWREVVAAVHGMAGTLIQQHHGAVVQFLGDGLLALFGAPTPSESDPENAIRAALAIQAGVAPLEIGQPVQMRAGIHTGLVVLGELGSKAKQEFTATGDAMNVAARLQSAAPPGGVLISHDTYRYVRGAFDVTPQSPLQVKGKSEPFQTYLVRRARPRVFGAVTRGVAGIETRTVGRESEMKQIRSAAVSALEEHRIVWAQLTGHAGIGKSRLIGDMTDDLAVRPEDIGVFKGRAFQGDQRQAFGLIRRIWFDRFQIADDAPLAEAEARWQEKFLELRGPGFEEAAHALGILVGLPFRDSPHIGAMRHDPAQVKGRGIVVSRELLDSLRARMNLAILLEDLHWADASSWEYLTRVILEGEAGTHGLFVLATARPDWDPPEALLEYPDYRQIQVASLSDAACRELALELLRSVEAVPGEVVRRIVERSEGVPYFVEEMVNWFLDRGIIDRESEPWRFVPARLEASPLPATLQHLLLTRLSSLNKTERAALQRGSIFGRHFWEGGLEALEVRAANRVLQDAQARGFVEMQLESSLVGDTEWSFHHNLLHEVTYESILKRERKGLHKAAGAWLAAQARQAGRLDEFAGPLGEHAERAGEMSAAADWYARAGDCARAQGALSEARRRYDRALELIPPDDCERRWQTLLGRNDVLRTLGETAAYRANVAALLKVAEELDDDRLPEAQYRQGFYLDSTGDYRGALQAYEVALAGARRKNNPKLETWLLALMVICQNRLGDLDGAAAAAQEALRRSHQEDETTAVRALSNVAVYYVESGDLTRAAELHREQAAINHRLGDRAGEANALANLGYDYLCLGLYQAGRSALEQSLRAGEAIGARREFAYARLNLALACWRTGDARAARQLLEEQQSELATMGDAFARAAGLSYLGLTLEQSGDVAAAARRFAEAWEAFSGLGVRGYAADALAGLARCALAQGDLDEAHRRATEVWDALQRRGARTMEFPVRAYQTCAEIFEAAGELEQSRIVVEAGYRELIQRAEKISNLEWGRSFLENVPEHRALIERWEQSGHSISKRPTHGGEHHDSRNQAHH